MNEEVRCYLACVRARAQAAGPTQPSTLVSRNDPTSTDITTATEENVVWGNAMPVELSRYALWDSRDLVRHDAACREILWHDDGDAFRRVVGSVKLSAKRPSLETVVSEDHLFEREETPPLRRHTQAP
jgi:hypothetical protein